MTEERRDATVVLEYAPQTRSRFLYGPQLFKVAGDDAEATGFYRLPFRLGHQLVKAHPQRFSYPDDSVVAQARVIPCLGAENPGAVAAAADSRATQRAAARAEADEAAADIPEPDGGEDDAASLLGPDPDLGDNVADAAPAEGTVAVETAEAPAPKKGGVKINVGKKADPSETTVEV